jgi:hypothetical protein
MADLAAVASNLVLRAAARLDMRLMMHASLDVVGAHRSSEADSWHDRGNLRRQFV